MAAKKIVTKKQLEVLLKKAEKAIVEWSKYKDGLQVALSSNPPGQPPRPPKG